MTARQIMVGVTAWVLAVGSVASLSWVAINSAGHEVARPNRLRLNAGPHALPSATPPPDLPATPNVPSASLTVTPTTTPAARTSTPQTQTTSMPVSTTQRSRMSRTAGRTTTTTRRPGRSRGNDGSDVELTADAVAATGDPWVLPTPTTVPIGDGGSDEFEVWLQSVAPAGGFESFSVSFVPWWYGGAGGDWGSGGGRQSGSDTAGARFARATGGTGGVDPGRSSRSLSLDGGLVWLRCDGTGLQQWSASPQDGWTLRAARQRGYLQARFRSDEGTVEVQAGCADSRPAYRYREQAAGSRTDGDWQAGLI